MKRDGKFRLDDILLTSGGHANRGANICLMEAVSWFAGEIHSDHPGCTSPLLAGLGRSVNDCIPTTKRQQLKPLIPLLIGTVDEARDWRDLFKTADWLLRTFVPRVLEHDRWPHEATRLRELRPIVDCGTAHEAQVTADSITNQVVSVLGGDGRAAITARYAGRTCYYAALGEYTLNALSTAASSAGSTIWCAMGYLAAPDSKELAAEAVAFYTKLVEDRQLPDVIHVSAPVACEVHQAVF